MSKLVTVLKQLVLEEGINIAELSRLTGILQPVLHRISTGETDNPRIDTVLPIARHFGISIEALMGEIPLPLNRTYGKKHLLLIELPLLDWDELIKLPSIELKEDRLFVYSSHQSLNEHSYALRVKDSTMLPDFAEGGILVVSFDLKPQNGNLVIIELEGQLMFKKILFDNDDIVLKPLNTDFKTICFGKEREHRYHGVVLEYRRDLK